MTRDFIRITERKCTPFFRWKVIPVLYEIKLTIIIWRFKGPVIGQRHAATPQIIYTKLHAAMPQKFGINDLRRGGMPLPNDCTLKRSLQICHLCLFLFNIISRCMLNIYRFFGYVQHFNFLESCSSSVLRWLEKETSQPARKKCIFFAKFICSKTLTLLVVVKYFVGCPSIKCFGHVLFIM